MLWNLALSSLSSLIINMIFEIANPNPKFLKAWADLVSKSKMLIMNVLMMTLTEN